MHRVFISYSSVDRSLVESLASDLVRLGHQVWFDQSLKGGQDWWNEILEQLRACDVLIFAISKESLKSDACQRELAYGLALNRAVIPLLLSDALRINVLPPSLQRRKCIHFACDEKDALLNLVGALNDISDVPALPSQLPQPPEIPLSPLASIVEQLRAKTLNEQQQVLIVHELKKLCVRPDTAEGALELMRQLLAHDSLLSSIGDEIKTFVAKEERIKSTEASPPASAGSSGQGSASKEEPHGTVIVERKKAWGSMVWPFRVYLDGEKVASLSNGEQTQMVVSPGIHAVQIRVGPENVPFMHSNTEELAINVQEGATVALLCGPALLSGKPHLKRK